MAIGHKEIQAFRNTMFRMQNIHIIYTSYTHPIYLFSYHYVFFAQSINNVRTPVARHPMVTMPSTIFKAYGCFQK